MMGNIFKSIKLNKKAFTIMELMVAVAISSLIMLFASNILLSYNQMFIKGLTDIDEVSLKEIYKMDRLLHGYGSIGDTIIKQGIEYKIEGEIIENKLKWRDDIWFPMIKKE